jgi:hypothetical protein
MPALRTASALVVVALATAGCMAGVKSGRSRVPVPPDAPGGPAWTQPEPPSTLLPSAPGAPTAPFEDPAARPVIPGRVIGADAQIGKLTRDDWTEFNRAWVLFVRKDRAWPEARDRWLARGGPAPYVLSENLLRYFLSASSHGDRRDLNWVAVSAQKAGDVAAAYFANLLALDSWPLKHPVRMRQPDGSVKEVTSWVNDDVTRQHAALILAAVGEPAVPHLLSSEVLRSPIPSVRRYAMYALGRIGTDTAVDSLAGMLASPEWQDRGAAAKGLGLALTYRKNERARPGRDRALRDPDEFVRKQASDGLSGRIRWEF